MKPKTAWIVFPIHFFNCRQMAQRGHRPQPNEMNYGGAEDTEKMGG